jgi:DNA polymerase III delta prime subunit
MNNFYKIKNLLIYGQPSTGKTTFCDLIIKKYFNDKNNDNILIMNASDERGIDIVRNKIKNFCKKKPTEKNNFKICILDECDNLTYDAQTNLRRILEDYNNTKFIFICNYIYKIINPIKSRCLELKFNHFSNDYIMKFSLNILKKENVIINDHFEDIYIKYINYLINLKKNDIRQIITYIEFLSIIQPLKYDISIINGIMGYLSIPFTKKILNQIHSIRNISNILQLLSHFSLKNILENFLYIVINNQKISIINKKKFIFLLSEIDSLKRENIDYEMIILKIIKEYLSIIN